ncbi:glucosaminidase domain-containing protein [Psychroflexus sediminis]|uniref:Peptidoglycan hydrolase n=1 Tax=Psychroflexus sediminis TaxID=470826 RepID=A0A1G7V184_9FLAO|nr:glucosaminidase domain-containing protein [Psychroflexus sediminis]SDG53553.1 Flagellum-specific peptidoglycan hydrolase FlgJ [Psychroflexus sediminis]
MKYTFAFSLIFLLMMMSCGTSKKTKSASAEQPRTQQPKPKAEQPNTIGNTDSEDSLNQETEEVEEVDLSSLNAVERYVYNYAGIAQEEMRLYGIPASITIAQGILESGSGSGKLTRRSNNHFGIKCNGWQGDKVYHDDDEAQECFRKYGDAKYSFRDHSLFLFERSRYGFLFDYDSDDYKSWARGLRRAGYATDPRYPEKLISLIERYQLNEFDKEVLGKTGDTALPKPQRLTLTNSEYYRVKRGDTLYNISEKFNLTVEELKLINKLKSDHIQVGQELKVKN